MMVSNTVLHRFLLISPLFIMLFIAACSDNVTDAEPEPEPEFIIGDPNPDPEFFEVFQLEDLEHGLESIDVIDEFRHYQSRIDLTADGETNLVFDLTIQENQQGGPRFSAFFFTGVNGTSIPIFRDETYNLIEDLDYFGEGPYSRLMAGNTPGLTVGEGVLEERGASAWSDSEMLLGGHQSRNTSALISVLNGTPTYIPFRIGERYGWAEILIYYDLGIEDLDLPEYRVIRAVLER